MKKLIGPEREVRISLLLIVKTKTKFKWKTNISLEKVLKKP